MTEWATERQAEMARETSRLVRDAEQWHAARRSGDRARLDKLTARFNRLYPGALDDVVAA